jgi:hypothetical protein
MRSESVDKPESLGAGPAESRLGEFVGFVRVRAGAWKALIYRPPEPTVLESATVDMANACRERSDGTARDTSRATVLGR